MLSVAEAHINAEHWLLELPAYNSLELVGMFLLARALCLYVPLRVRTRAREAPRVCGCECV